MSEAIIQSAQVLPKVEALPWGGATRPGTTLTSVATSRPGVDVEGFAARDRELAWRDISLAQAIKAVAERAASAFQVQIGAPSIQAAPDISVSSEAAGTVASGAVSATLTGFVQASRVSITLGGTVTSDDGRGLIVPVGVITGGTINYQSGALVLATTADDGLVAVIKYRSVQYLAANSADADTGQSSAPGGYSGVKHVDNSSVPDPGALNADKHLYRRDLLLYEVLQHASEIFQRLQAGLPYADLGAASPIPTVADLTVPPWPNWLQQSFPQSWSQARAKESLVEASASQRWGPQVYSDPDRNLAWRDNVLAWYSAQLSLLLGFKIQLITGQPTILTERGEVILTETGSHMLLERTEATFQRAGACELYEKANRLLVRAVEPVPVLYLLTERRKKFLTRDGKAIWFKPVEATIPAIDRPAVPSIKNREATTYLLAHEDANYRVFQAYPRSAYGELSLVYDRARREVRWRTECLSQVHKPREAAPIFEGVRPQQLVQIIADVPSNQDAAYCKHQASQWQPTGYQEDLIQNVNLASKKPNSGTLTGFTAGMTYGQQIIFSKPGSAAYVNFVLDGRFFEAQRLWWQFNIALNPAIEVSQKGSSYSSAVPGAAYTSVNGTIQLSGTATQTINWLVSLPAGSYRVKFQWQDTSTARTKVRAVLKYDGQQVFGGLWQAASAAVADSLPATILAAGPASKALSLTLTLGSQTSGQLKLVGFTLERLTVDPDFQYRVNFELCDRDGATLTPIAGGTKLVRGWLKAGQAEVCGTGWIDASTLADRYQASLRITLLDQPPLPLQISALDQRRLISISRTPNYALAGQLKSSLLAQAISTVQASYRRALALSPDVEFRQASGSALLWTAASTEAWLTRLELLESRVRVAFRAPSIGDLGRPALVPRGLIPGRNTVVAELGSIGSTPELVPLQPWMLPLNLPVAHESFWSTEAPEPELQIV